MRLMTLHNGSTDLLAAAVGDTRVDLARAAAVLGLPAPGGDMVEVLAADGGLARVQELVDRVQDEGLAEDESVAASPSCRVRPPITRPPKVICAGRNYAEHAAEANVPTPDHPNLFARLPQTLIGAGEPIVVPRVSDMVDWEAELAVVVGRAGRYVAAEDAYDHIAGYAAFNDVTVRDFQRRVPQWLAGKNFPSSGPFGPALVTRDEVPDPHALRIELRVNGQTMQSASTAEMVFDIPQLIADISTWTELEPGDVIATGTPAGVGFVRDPPRFLRPGDIAEVSIENVGVLANPVVEETLV